MPRSDQKWVSTARTDYTGYSSTSYTRNLSKELRHRHLTGERRPVDQPHPWYRDSFSGAEALRPLEELDRDVFEQWAMLGGYGPADLRWS